jgi:nucleoside-diphosphate-sugar epimerase
MYPAALLTLMDYFVTGATGFVGGRVARDLLAAGHRVRAVVRTPGKAGDLREAGAELFEGDVTQKESMRKAMEGADGVFHIAGWYKVGARDKRPGQAINVEGTRNVLELMKEVGLPKGVYTSTLGVFGDTKAKLVDEHYRMNGPWLSQYDRTKWVAHYEVAEPMMRDGLPLVIVQPGLVYGPGDTSALRPTLLDYLRRKLKRVPAGAAYCWGHIEDTARGHILAMEKGKAGESYIIAGPAHTLVEAFEIAERITGIPAPRSHPSPGTVRMISRMMAFVEKFKAVSESMSSEQLRVLAGATYLGDSSKARRELGFSARPLEEGLRETLAHEMALLGLGKLAPVPGSTMA